VVSVSFTDALIVQGVVKGILLYIEKHVKANGKQVHEAGLASFRTVVLDRPDVRDTLQARLLSLIVAERKGEAIPW